MEEDKKKEMYQNLARKLVGIHRIPKCEGCSCFIESLRDFEKALNQEQGDWVKGIWEEMKEISSKAKTSHGCLGCNPCYPVPISNQLYELKDGPSQSVLQPQCGSTSQEEGSWPVEPGDYIVGNKEASVAISTLASEALPERFALEKGLFNVALIGKTETENIGIEKVIKNTITNPNIRVLILAGKDASGHFPADAFRSLIGKGVDGQGRIREAKGMRPVLKNVTQDEIVRFSRQISLIDLAGEEDINRIQEEVEKHISLRPNACEKPVSIPATPHIQATLEEHFFLDPKGFFIIHVNPIEGKILLEHYENSGTLTQVIEGEDPKAIYFTAIRRGLISRLDHACYLGKELERAKLSLKYRFSYIQDGAGVQVEGAA